MEKDSPQSVTEEVEFATTSSNTVAVVEGESYTVTDDVATHQTEDGYVFLTGTEAYYVPVNDGWLVPSGDEPQEVLEAINDMDEMCAEADVTGYPVEFTVGYRSDTGPYDSGWQKEMIRPNSEVASEIDSLIHEVRIDVSVDDDGTVRVTDFDIWPSSQDVTIDL